MFFSGEELETVPHLFHINLVREDILSVLDVFSGEELETVPHLFLCTVKGLYDCGKCFSASGV